MKKTILFIYAQNVYPTRNMVSDLMYSFKRHSENRIIYYNRFSNKMPAYLRLMDYDAVIFHQSVTFCVEPEKGRRRINDFRQFIEGSKAVKVALFQDEYVCTNISVEFINELKIDYAYTVMPQSEWAMVYGKVRKECQIIPMLTGYIEDKGEDYYISRLHKSRNVDVGYRAVWNKQLIVLGRFGYDKIRIAECFDKALKNTQYKTDIKVGWEYILKGEKWNEFLSSCRFMLGVESGGSVLDRDGSIYKSVSDAIAENPDITVEELYNRYIDRYDNELRLHAISPRHFEAIEEGVCQILYEGEYSGVLEPGIHYVELKKDHSNLNDIVEFIGDETARMTIVENAYNDIVLSGKYTYSRFVDGFFNRIFENYKDTKKVVSWNRLIVIVMAALHEKSIVLCIMIIQILKKFKLKQIIRQTALGRLFMKKYYAKRL